MTYPDILKYYSVDSDIRNLRDYPILKSLGLSGLPSDLKWLYHYYNPNRIRKMKAQNFIILSRNGALGLGKFPFHDWHKREKENILSAVGLRIEYSEPVEAGLNRGTFKTIGDKEHSEIIKLYIEGSSMGKISKQVNRSSKSIKDHIDQHNLAVERSAFCPQCRRVHSSFEGKTAVRT